MHVEINGKVTDVAERSTLAEVLEGEHVPPRGVAVALDGAVVPRARWERTTVPAGATVEIMTAVQGG